MVAARYRLVLSVPGSPRLLASALIGRLPQGMSSLAILLLVRGSTHSYAVAALSVALYTLSSALCAPFQGHLVDRFGRARVLVPSALGQGAALIALVLASAGQAGGSALVGLAALAGGLMPPVAPTVRALLGEVFRDPSTRESAYALDAVVQEVIWTAGPLVVAVLIAAVSAAAAVLLVGAISVVGTLLFVFSPLARGRARPGPADDRRTALASRELRRLLLPVALTGAGLGAIEVGLPALALHAGSRTASGLLLAVWSVGSMVGGLWYGSRTWRSPLAGRYRTLLVAAVACSAPLIAARSVPAGVVCSLLAGLTIAPVFSCQYALVGRLVSAGSETEAFTWISGALVAGIAAGTALGGLAVGPGGTGAPFMISCLATGLAAVAAARAAGPPPLDVVSTA
jgi:MFS family permease